jgi:uroporphyrinogen decarboxylase
MAYKAKAMISPAMTRRWCMPCWNDWVGKSSRAGVPLFGVDSDGYIGELIPLWIESGVNVCDPMEVAAHNDLNEYRRLHGDKMAYQGGVDKRCMAKGGQTIRDEMKRLEPVIRSGGYIPSCDHGVPSDVSWPNFVEYGRLLAEATGWL